MSVLIADVPVHDRPRERLFRQGADALSDRELLAVLLRSGTRGTSALDLAAELLADYGTLGALAAARPEELASRKGVGQAKAAAILAAFKLAARAEGVGARLSVLRRPEDVAAVARSELEGLRRERVVVLVCDTANQVRHVSTVSEGAADRSLVPVREILNAVLRHDGRAFALAHNHPSGNPEPSDDDRQVTEQLRNAARMVGLRFLGHVVIAGDRWQAVT